MGDATNLVLILAGELLKKAESLLVMGLHPSEVIKGYELAQSKALAEIESAIYAYCCQRNIDRILYRNIIIQPANSPNAVYISCCSQARYCIQAIWI